MSQNAPVSIRDDDSGPPDSMTNILPREDSRASMVPLRAATLAASSSGISMVNTAGQPAPPAGATVSRPVTSTETRPVMAPPITPAMAMPQTQAVGSTAQAVPTSAGGVVGVGHRLPQQHQQPHQQFQQPQQQPTQHRNQYPHETPGQAGELLFSPEPAVSVHQVFLTCSGARRTSMISRVFQAHRKVCAAFT